MTSMANVVSLKPSEGTVSVNVCVPVSFDTINHKWGNAT